MNSMISSFFSDKINCLNKNIGWKQDNLLQSIKDIQVIKKKNEGAPFIFDLSEIKLLNMQGPSKLNSQRQVLKQVNQNQLQTGRYNTSRAFNKQNKMKMFDIQILDVKEKKIMFSTYNNKRQREDNKEQKIKYTYQRNLKKNCQINIINKKLSIKQTVGQNKLDKFLLIQNFKCPLTQGSVIKFGKSPFEVIKLSTSLKNYKQQYIQKEQQKQKFIIKQHSQISKQDQNYDKQICKFCLMNNTQFNDLNLQNNSNSLKLNSLLLSPCKCKGSCSKVHWLCLKQWAKSKFTIKQTQTVQIYDYSRLVCQICKQKIPLRYGIQLQSKLSNISVNTARTSRRTQSVRTKSTLQSQTIKRQNITINLLESLSFDQQKGTTQNYIWLRNYCSTQPSNSFQNQIYIKLKYIEGKNIKIGRQKSCNWQIQDVTVSRSHAEIQFDKDRKVFFLKDQRSKFGTMVKLQDSQQLDLNKFKQVPSIKIIIANVLLAVLLKHN